MQVSFFTKVSNPIPISQELTWVDFVEKLGSHREVADKLDASAISPAEWPKGVRRSNDKVLRVHFAALDLDKITDETLASVLKLLEPYQYLLHTTYSHAQSTLNCLRVYLELSRAVDAAEWPVFWKNLNALAGGVSDSACKDVSRVYFTPSMPPGTQDKNYVRSHGGCPLNVDSMLSRPQAKPQPSNLVTISNLMMFAKGLSRKPGLEGLLGAQILKVARGEIFAENGKRDCTLFKICARLAERWPKADPKQVASLFEPSLDKMRAESADAPTVEDVIEKFSRKQEEVSTNDPSDLKNEISDAFCGKRDTPYTEEELNCFAAEADIPRDRLNSRWIILKGDSCYLFLGGKYNKPVSTKELFHAARIDLSPAVTAGVDCFRWTAKGERIPKKEQELIKDYGTLAREVVVDLSAQKSTYDWKTQTLTEAPCPLRDLKPEFSEHVDQYLKLLGGDSVEQLLDWMASVTRLEKPCSALFLHGTSSAGKSLLALGLTRLWTLGTPTQLKNVLADFNDSLNHSPLVVADEGIGVATQKESGSAEIGSLIQDYSRPFKRKFKDIATLKGSLRLIVTANNKSAFSWKESLNTDDIQALRDRILSIEVGKDSAAYLRSLGETRELFVWGDAIAKHALWLRANREVNNDLRVLVAGKDSSHVDDIVANTKMGPHVSDWLVCYLMNPKRIDTEDALQIRIYQGRLLVMARCLVENWETYITNKDKRFATMNAISEALSSMSAPKRKQLYDNHKTKMNYQQIETRYLLSWAVKHGYSSEKILEALSHDTPSIFGERTE